MAGRLLLLCTVLVYSASCLPTEERTELSTPFSTETVATSEAPTAVSKIGKVISQVTGKVKEEAGAIYGFFRNLPIPFTHDAENSTTVAPLDPPPTVPVFHPPPVEFY